MKPTNELRRVGQRIGQALHWDALMRTLTAGRNRDTQPLPEWVIIYPTAQGFCCIYHGVSMEFREMLDVQIWAEEEDVRIYYMGL